MRVFDDLWNQYHDDYKGIWRYETSLQIGGETIPQDRILKKSWNGGTTLTDFDIGISPAQKFTAVIDVDSFSTTQDQKVIVKIRVVGDLGTTPYYDFGTYYTDKITSKGRRYTFDCLDAMKYADRSGVDFRNTAMTEAVQAIAGIIGCAADTGNINYDIGDIDLTGYSLHEILGFIASANGGNFVIDFSNTLRLIKLEINEPAAVINTFNAIRTKRIGDVKELSGIVIQTDNDNGTEYISGGGENVLSFFNPLASQEIVDNLFTQLKAYQYTPCEVVTAYINPSIELGDTVEVRSRLTQIWNWDLSQNLTVNFSAPSNFDKYNKYEFKGTLSREIERISRSESFYNTIIEVVRQEVLATENIHAASAFISDMFVERLLTNIENFICVPNLVLRDDNTCEWLDGTPTYNCITSAPYSDIRPHIDAESIYMKFVESRLVPVNDLSRLTQEHIEPLIINERQFYYTSILGGKDPYEYFTSSPPESKYPDITPENAEMFKIYIRKAAENHVKMSFNFNKVDVSGEERATFDVQISLGVGDENGNGVAHLHKREDGIYLIYTLQADTGTLKAGDETGLRITNSGVPEQRDVTTGEWLPIGSGGGGGSLLELDKIDIAKDLSFFAASYGGMTTSYSTVLDGGGLITQLINRESGKVIGVNWL